MIIDKIYIYKYNYVNSIVIKINLKIYSLILLFMKD